MSQGIISQSWKLIFPYEDLISLGRSEEVLIKISRDLNAYIGKPFEEIAKEFLWETNKGNFSKIGRWWHKGEEIDIVALNEEGEDIFFFECKWSKLDERDALKILTDLKQKAALGKKATRHLIYQTLMRPSLRDRITKLTFFHSGLTKHPLHQGRIPENVFAFAFFIKIYSDKNDRKPNSFIIRISSRENHS
jgi:hypothetical protein